MTETKSALQDYLRTLRPEIKNLPSYNAGLSIEYVRANYGVTDVAKLGSNENPYGASPKVHEALRKALSEVALYPEPSCDPLRMAMARHLGIDPSRLIFGNGSEELIAIAVHTFLSSGSRVVTFAPSFGLHVIWPNSVGAQVECVRVDADYAMDMDEVLAALTPKTDMLVFGNPSNPVGTSLSAADVRCILDHLSPRTLLIFDEAYLEYASAEPGYPDFLRILNESQHSWLILRTFSKAYGLAGLRIGYAIASHPELIGLMDRVRAPFNVNRLAQVAALAALGDAEFMRAGVERTVTERERMRGELDAAGYRVAPSLTNFLFVQAREEADDLAIKLLGKGVIVKPWREAGFRDHVRISVGLPTDDDHFLSAWKAVAR